MLTWAPVHIHRVVAARCRNLWGSMAIDRDGSPNPNPNKCTHVVQVVPICVDKFVHMGLDR